MEIKQKKPRGGKANTTKQALSLDLTKKKAQRFTLYRWDRPEEVLYRVHKESSLRALAEEALVNRVLLSHVDLANGHLYGLTTPVFLSVLHYAKIDDSNAAYSRWTLSDLSWASFVRTDLTGSRFVGCKFQWTDFRDAKLSRSTFAECTFVGCNFRGVVAKKAKFYKCTFDKCLGEMNLGEKSHEVQVEKIDL